MALKLGRLGGLASLAVLAVLALRGSVAGAEPGPEKGRLRTVAQPIYGEYVVMLESDAARRASAPLSAGPPVRRVASELLRQGGGLGFVYEHAVVGFSAFMSASRAEALATDPRVAWVEENGKVRVAGSGSQVAGSEIWGLDRIDQLDTSFPALDGTYEWHYDGAGVRAYVIDTGIRSTHEQFEGRVGSGFTAILDGSGTEDCHGHGTHVSAVIGGRDTGVAKAVDLVPVRVFGCAGTGSVAGIIAGVDWVNADYAAWAPAGFPKRAVVNMSLVAGDSAALDAAVQSTISDPLVGVPVVAAAGNDAGSACAQSPARIPDAVTVGATTIADARWPSSNFGTCLDLFAPGAVVLSALDEADDAYGFISGTSVAAPHVAGVAALIHTEAGCCVTRSPGEIQSTLVSDALPGLVGSPGTGSPNLLLQTHPDRNPPSASILSPPADTTVSGLLEVSWTATDDTTAFADLEAHLRIAGGATLDTDAMPALGTLGWNTAGSPDGWYDLEVLVLDQAGNADVQDLRVRLLNDPPTEIFSDGFESGDVSAWTSAVP